MSPVKLVIFDCDGTLVDSQGLICRAMGGAFADAGLAPPAREAVLHVVGLELGEAVGRLLPEEHAHHGVKVTEGYRAHHARLRVEERLLEPLFPGAEETIRALAEGDALLGIATGKSRKGTEALLEAHNLRRYFIDIRTADDGPGKPHPAILEDAMRTVGAERADTVMIGDTVYDMHLAANAGVAAFGVAWGYHPEAELKRAGARTVLKGFAEVPPALARHWAEGRAP